MDVDNNIAEDAELVAGTKLIGVAIPQEVLSGALKTHSFISQHV